MNISIQSLLTVHRAGYFYQSVPMRRTSSFAANKSVPFTFLKQQKKKKNRQFIVLTLKLQSHFKTNVRQSVDLSFTGRTKYTDHVCGAGNDIICLDSICQIGFKAGFFFFCIKTPLIFFAPRALCGFVYIACKGL